MSPSAVNCATSPPEAWASPQVALDAWGERESSLYREVFRPAPQLTPSEWAREHRIVSQGPKTGTRWDPDLTPYLEEIMDFVVNPWARRGVVEKSARVGFTEGVIGNLLLYNIDQDLCNAIVLQPSDKEAEAYSKEQIGPMLDLNPRVGEKIGSTGSRSPDTTITYKKFGTHTLLLLGSASEKNLRRRSAKWALSDEVDAMKVEGVEGDPLLRLEKRLEDFEDGVHLMGSTPTLQGQSRITREFARSDQRYWHVPCPLCSAEQALRWGSPDKPYGIKWDREIFCKQCGAEAPLRASKCADCGGEEFVARHLHETAHYQCGHCHGRIEEHLKAEMIQAGRWVPTRPENRIPGWHIDALISLMVGARWGKLSEEWIEAQDDPEDLKVFVQTVLAEAYEDRAQEVDLDTLKARAEEYVGTDGAVVDVPDGVGVLTSFTDVQGSWLEILVRGWGMGEESWDVFHERIYGDPEAAETWARLERILARPWIHEAGTKMHLSWSFIDAGFAWDKVCGFVKGKEPRNIWASLGDRAEDHRHDPIKKPGRTNAAGVRVYTLGTFKLKDIFFRRLRVRRPGPRYLHLRANNPDRCNGFDAEYYAQFDSEKKRPSKGGKMKWAKTMVRNETVDCHVGNIGAFLALGTAVRGENMQAFVDVARTGKVPLKKRRRGRVRSKGVVA